MAKQAVYAPARGFTALELIIVLVIGFTIIALSASKMGEMFRSSKTTQAIASILGLASATRELYEFQGYGAAGDNLIPLLIDNDLAPKLLAVTANTTGDTRTFDNEWGGIVTMEVGQNNTAVLTYNKVPPLACKKLVKSTLQTGTFKTIQGAGNVVLDRASTATDITTACTPAANAQDITLTFTL